VLPKKEALDLERLITKLNLRLGGIKDLRKLPDVLFVIDTHREVTAIKEANTLNIPVIAMVDTNCDPDGVSFPIPGNDDAGRAIALYCDLIAKAAIDGISRSQGSLGMDLGAAETPVVEPVTPELRARLWHDCGLIRDAAGLERLRTAPHLLTRLIAESALAREESRGGHFRAARPNLQQSALAAADLLLKYRVEEHARD